MTGKPARLAPPKEGYWKSRGKRGKTKMIPFSEMEDDHLQRAYFVSQNKQLEFSNKLIKFTDLAEEIEKEALSRGLTLRSIEDEPNHKVGNYFANNRNLKSKM